jgi:rhodanese-related sulfurtransferase
MREITVKTLYEYLQNTENTPLLLDVREQWEFNVCHLEGVTLVPMGQVPEHIQSWNKDQEIIVICHHGIRSLQVAHFMEESGFQQMVNLIGGMHAWALSVDKQMSTY